MQSSPVARFATFFIVTAAVLTPQTASAQAWADKMFEAREHNFGVVPQGADTVFRFEVTNLYEEDIHLASVRSSCGCTSPSIENDTLKTYEKGYIVAKLNTRAFTGNRSATLTVTIDRPFPARVQLRVFADIRGDLSFQPGSVQFGTVDQGSAAEKRVTVTRRGWSGWRISDVRSASDNLEVVLSQPRQWAGQTNYELLVRLKPNATAGILKEQLMLVTNDQRSPRIPLDVEGRVLPAISVAPLNLVLGDVPTGQVVKKRLIVRGKKPFKVTRVTCGADGFRFQTDENLADRHIINVEFAPTGEATQIRAPIVVETDRGEKFTAQCVVYATLLPADTQQAPGGSGSLDSSTATAASTDP